MILRNKNKCKDENEGVLVASMKKKLTHQSAITRFLKALHPTNVFNQFSKIRNKLFSLTFLLMFAFGMMGLLIFQFLSNIYEEKIYEEAANNLHLSSTVLDRELYNIEDFSFSIVTDPSVQNYLDQLRADNISYNTYRVRTNLVDRMILFANQERYIQSVQIMDARQNMMVAGFTPDVDIDMDETKDMIEQAGGGNVWRNTEHGEYLVAAREIKKQENLSLDHLGYLIITLNIEDLIDDTLNFAPDKNFVITKGEEVVYTDNFKPFEVDSFLKTKEAEDGYRIVNVDDKEYFITGQPSRYFDLTYYNVLPFEDVDSKKAMITQMMIGYLLLVVIITVFISRQSAKAISKPIEELTQRMKKVQKGDFDQVEYEKKNYLKDEIGDLQENFHIMLNKINELIKENYTKQLVIKETEYKALQSQINPHFLYNTLDSIHWMAKMNQQEKISTMAEALGNMMRNIISKKEPLIKISEELEIVENYITIQKYRYGERLQFKLEKEPGAEYLSIPKLTIQPIVENAIQHGLEEMMETCTISVQISTGEDDVRIIVRDNGPGIDKATIQKIHEGKVKPKGSGIGLYNINERIHLMFGEDGGVKIDRENEEGTAVIITLPFMKG